MDSKTKIEGGVHAFLADGGELGALMRAFDWDTTSLGPIAGWPQSLKTTVGLLLRSPVPIVLLWGEDGVMIYNDPYSGFAGGRHPQLLGSKVREGWAEVAEFNDNVMRVGLEGGTLSYRDQELTLVRKGVPEPVWMNLDYSPVLDEGGRPAGVLAIVVETTERVLAMRHQQLLIDELNHRVKNTLATVQSIAAQTFKPNGEGTVEAQRARELFDARLVALSNAHNVLTRGNWDGAALRAIVEEAITPHRGGGHDPFRIEGPSVILTSKTALSIAMALHELCTNAAKYGALSTPAGTVAIAWTEEAASAEGRRLRLDWRERGGPTVTAPSRRGFGSRLIERQLAREFGGEVRLAFEASGVTCTIVAPLVTSRHGMGSNHGLPALSTQGDGP